MDDNETKFSDQTRHQKINIFHDKQKCPPPSRNFSSTLPKGINKDKIKDKKDERANKYLKISEHETNTLQKEKEIRKNM